jgi:hypothetical protein
MSSTHDTTSGDGKRVNTLRWVFLIIALLLVVMQVKRCAVKHKAKAEAEKAAATSYAAVHPPVPVPTQRQSVVYATTPATIVADYEFNIESDAPINVEYPGEKPALYTPGKGFQQMSQPRQSGPKVFTDPNDPANGHVAFRLYPVHNKK